MEKKKIRKQFVSFTINVNLKIVILLGIIKK